MTSCEILVTEALSSPLVRAMMRGLLEAGCPLNIPRHVVCEPCNNSLAGGYDLLHNQVVLCSEKCTTLAKVTTILSHELVHMYDNCVAKVDWSNKHHLACSEIRAASLAHCSGPISGALEDGGSWMRLSGQHGECVKRKAARSVRAILKCSNAEADEAVSQVFNKCYEDTEPVGRYRCHYSL